MTTLALAHSGSFKLVQLVALSFRAQWIMFVIPALYLLTNWMLLADVESYRIAPVYRLLLNLLTFALPVGLFVLMVLRMAQYALIEKPSSLFGAISGELRELMTRPARIINALPVFAAMIVFNKAMVELKPAIPSINPFSWDKAFMELDRTLHFGVDPWVLLQPLMGFDYVTFAINIAYNFWFLALFGAWVWFGFRKNAGELRARFFLSYMLTWWIGGGLLAVLFSSAGPVYYDELGLTPNPYTELFAYLNSVDTRIPLWFLDTQKMLWDGYIGKVPALGISAMPSMHNASAVLFALAFRHVSKGLGWVFAIYAVVILVGSVHLGWHYAVDGYAGIVIAGFSWWLAGLIARWFTALPVSQRYDAELARL